MRPRGPSRRRRNPSTLPVLDEAVEEGVVDLELLAPGSLVDFDTSELVAPAVEKGQELEVFSVQDVRNWLHRIGFSEYEDVFTLNEINGNVLKTLTSEELRDDLGITNLRHRRDIGDAIQRLVAATDAATVDALPEHGRVLDHLSNIRTVHSWMRLGVQMLAFSILTLRLAPNFRSTAIVTAASLYFAVVGIVALLYGIMRYKAVMKMIERSVSVVFAHAYFYISRFPYSSVLMRSVRH